MTALSSRRAWPNRHPVAEGAAVVDAARNVTLNLRDPLRAELQLSGDAKVGSDGRFQLRGTRTGMNWVINAQLVMPNLNQPLLIGGGSPKIIGGFGPVEYADHIPVTHGHLNCRYASFR